jgi:hypothetical protein
MAAVTVASAGMNAEVTAAVNVANALIAAQAMPPMAKRPKRHWALIKTLTPMRQTMALHPLKTMSAVNAARVTATAVTAANALAKHVRTLQTVKPLAMTPPSPTAKVQKSRPMTAQPHALISSGPSKLQPLRHRFRRNKHLKPLKKLHLLQCLK